MKSILTWTLLLFFVIILPGYYWGGEELAKSILIGFLLSLVNIVIGYNSIRWSFNRGTKTFLTVVYSGMAIRFIGFILSLFFVYKYTNLPITGFVLSFMVFYILFQYQEVKLINSEMKDKKAKINAV